MKLTTDQKKLLIDLKGSLTRGSASMSCAGWREEAAKSMEASGLVQLKSRMGKTPFYFITEKGLKEVA